MTNQADYPFTVVAVTPRKRIVGASGFYCKSFEAAREFAATLVDMGFIPNLRSIEVLDRGVVVETYRV